MKLDAKHLDRLIAEELQALFEMLDLASMRTTPAPATGPAGTSEQPPVKKPLYKEPKPKKGYHTDVGYWSGIPRQRKDVDEETFNRLAAPVPALGGMVTSIDAMKDYQSGKASGPETATQVATAVAQEFNPAKKLRNIKRVYDSATGGYGVATGKDPAAELVKKGHRGLPSAYKDPKKHARQQVAATIAADPRLKSAARDNLTGAELDARNKARLAARGIGTGPTSPEDKLAQDVSAYKRLTSVAGHGGRAGKGGRRELAAAKMKDIKKQERARDLKKAAAYRKSPERAAEVAEMDRVWREPESAGTYPRSGARQRAPETAVAKASTPQKTKEQEKQDRRARRTRRAKRAAAAGGAKPVSEGIKSTMLTENQIKRFQKLANCKSPQKRLITEAVDPLTIIVVVLGGLLSGELHSRVDAAGRAAMKGTTEEEEFSPSLLQAPITNAVQWVWKKLKSAAESFEKEGDSSLASVLNTLEGAGKDVQLSPEQIAMIQERFGDDEELAALLAQLAEVEEEDYREVLSQVEQHIRSKLGI